MPPDSGGHGRPRMLTAMDATGSETEPVPDTTGATPRYVRMPEHGILAGVAAGLSAATGLEVVALRIALVVLTFLHGAGLLAYLAAWVALPTLADAQAGRRPRHRKLAVAAGAALAGAAVILLVTPFGFEAWELAPLLIGIAVALWRSNPPRNLLPPKPPHEISRFRGDPGGPAPVGPPAALAVTPSRPGFPIGRMTVAAVLLAVAAALALSRAGAITFTAGRAASLVLLVTGASLVLAAFLARPRWPVFLALALMPVALGLGTLDHMGLDVFAPAGSYRVTATDLADVPTGVRHGVGDVNLDLSALNFAAGDSRSVTATTALGNITIWVPTGTAVSLDAEAGWGAVEPPGVSRPWSVGATDHTLLAGDRGSLVLHLRAGVGTITVVRSSPSSPQVP